MQATTISQPYALLTGGVMTYPTPPPPRTLTESSQIRHDLRERLHLIGLTDAELRARLDMIRRRVQALTAGHAQPPGNADAATAQRP